MKRTIRMMSSAYKVKGQGVLSAYEEQVNLVKKNLGEYIVYENEFGRADIVHFHTIDLKFFLMLPFIKLSAKTVGYIHFLPETLENSIRLPKIIKKIFYRYVIAFYKSMDYLITVNPYFIDKLVEYGVQRDKISYIPNYVSSDNFYRLSKSKRYEIRRKYEIEEDKFVVLTVGQLQKRKGIFDFLELAAKMPDIQFVWAGGFSFKNISDGYHEIKEILKNPPSNVKFIGIVPRESMNDIYNMSDMLFLPSYEELFPMTILESANVKIPILLRDIELYKGILDGYYIKGNNNEEFKDNIYKLKERGSYYNKACKMADMCSKYYSEFSVSSMWKTYYNRVYKLNRKRKVWRNINEV